MRDPAPAPLKGVLPDHAQVGAGGCRTGLGQRGRHTATSGCAAHDVRASLEAEEGVLARVEAAASRFRRVPGSRLPGAGRGRSRGARSGRARGRLRSVRRQSRPRARSEAGECAQAAAPGARGWPRTAGRGASVSPGVRGSSGRDGLGPAGSGGEPARSVSRGGLEPGSNLGPSCAWLPGPRRPRALPALRAVHRRPPAVLPQPRAAGGCALSPQPVRQRPRLAHRRGAAAVVPPLLPGSPRQPMSTGHLPAVRGSRDRGRCRPIDWGRLLINL